MKDFRVGQLVNGGNDSCMVDLTKVIVDVEYKFVGSPPFFALLI